MSDPERLSAERLAEIRERDAKHGDFVAFADHVGEYDCRDLLRELDAVTREKDGLFDSLTIVKSELRTATLARELLANDTEWLRHEIELFRVSVATLTRERDQAIERAERCEVYYNALTTLRDKT